MVKAGEQINLFLSWRGKQPVDGLRLTLPPGWRLEQGVALPANRQFHIPLEIQGERGRAGTYRITAPQRLRGPHQFVLQVDAGTITGGYTWQLVPFVLEASGDGKQELPLEEHMLARKVLLEPPDQGSNRALLLSDDTETPPEFPAASTPVLSMRSSFTVELWFRTVHLGGVVLTSWDGNPNQAYPIELVIDPRGHLLWYWGRPGLHRSLATPRPVADGSWHHAAAVFDAGSGLYRLLLDGATVDSLFAPEPPIAALALPPAFGGRPPGPTGERASGFNGMVDEVRFWSYARSPREVRRNMRISMTSRNGLTVLGFDGERAGEQVQARPDRIRPAPGLAFFYPVRHFRASAERHVVTLTWSIEAPQKQIFEIERSTDGQVFETTGAIEVSASDVTGHLGPRRYTFSDWTAPAEVPVWYYRIRQRLPDGSEQTSGVIKLGRGQSRDEAVALVGSSPNPFNSTTVLSYEVREAQPVTLSVWDLSGQLVDVLVRNEYQEPGTYQVRFDAGDLPSGIYFARLITPEGTQTAKMMLMK